MTASYYERRGCAVLDCYGRSRLCRGVTMNGNLCGGKQFQLEFCRRRSGGVGRGRVLIIKCTNGKREGYGGRGLGARGGQVARENENGLLGERTTESSGNGKKTSGMECEAEGRFRGTESNESMRIVMPGWHQDDKAIFSLAVPAALALAADPLLQVVDTAFVGHAGPEALAALGINSGLFTFSFLVFNFLGTATTPMVARARSSKNHAKAGLVTLQALTVASVSGSLLAVGLLSLSDQALMVMGADPVGHPVTYELAKQFLHVRACAAPAVMITTVGQGVFGGLQDMKTPLGITMMANMINLGLDIVLILGLGLGVKGAATATTVAEWTAAGSYLFFLWKRRDMLGGSEAPKQIAALASESLSDLLVSFRPFFKAGGAVLMRTMLLLGTKTLASATAARLGSTSIASHQVVMQLWLLTSMMVDSLAVSGQSLVAVELGKGKSSSLEDQKSPVVELDTSGARRVSDRLIQLGVGSGVVLAVTFGIASPWIPKIFTEDADVEQAILSILPIAIAMLPVNAGVYVLDGILVGSRDFKWMAKAMTVAAGSAIALLATVEPWELGLEGVWYALAALMTFRLGTLLWRYYSPDGPLAPIAESKAALTRAVDEGEKDKTGLKHAKGHISPMYINHDANESAIDALEQE
eukprot:jgi/Picsp_1/3171/NSC_06011-R1_dna-damage-inducible protein f